jgi:hypothetical protein
MAERIVPLLATQVARVRFPVPARPTFGVEKAALFCNPASGGTFSSTAIEMIKWVNFFSSSASEGVPHLEVQGPRRSKVTKVYYGFIIPKNKCVKKSAQSG